MLNVGRNVQRHWFKLSSAAAAAVHIQATHHGVEFDIGRHVTSFIIGDRNSDGSVLYPTADQFANIGIPLIGLWTIKNITTIEVEVQVENVTQLTKLTGPFVE